MGGPLREGGKGGRRSFGTGYGAGASVDIAGDAVGRVEAGVDGSGGGEGRSEAAASQRRVLAMTRWAYLCCELACKQCTDFEKSIQAELQISRTCSDALGLRPRLRAHVLKPLLRP